MSVTIYELVNRAGEPYEVEVLGRFMYRARAERALRELGPRKLAEKMLDRSPVYVIRDEKINDDIE